MTNNKKKLIKKVTLGIVLIAAISSMGYYAYLNVFNNQYELTYEIQKNKNWEPSLRSYKFLARNDSIAAEEAVDWLVYQFIFDNPELEKSKYRYQYKHLRLDNKTKDAHVRVPVSLVRNTLLKGHSSKYAKFDERDVDWLMFTDTIPYFNYDMSVWLDNPYEERRLRFIADNDYEAVNIAIDTVAYYISRNWYYANRPIDDILVINNFTLNFVHTWESNVHYRIANSPYCEGLNLRRYSVRYRGLIDE
ncbi:MAG: hypothetical protein J6U46_05530 [Bacteroidaceae bacterium]|nr:hypothetical protein [Bacteroidaceae bacterium]